MWVKGSFVYGTHILHMTESHTEDENLSITHQNVYLRYCPYSSSEVSSQVLISSMICLGT